jgi:hypothetical protein
MGLTKTNGRHGEDLTIGQELQQLMVGMLEIPIMFTSKLKIESKMELTVAL